MITVRLYGLLRLDSGIKVLQLEAAGMKQVYAALIAGSGRITSKDLDGSVILISGKAGTWNSKLKNGDEVTLLSPVAGG